MSTMSIAMVYARLIQKGLKTMNEVPESIRAEVEDILYPQPEQDPVQVEE